MTTSTGNKDEDAPTTKKAKLSVDNVDAVDTVKIDVDVHVDLTELATVTKACWELYRSYLDFDEEDDDEDDDVDDDKDENTNTTPADEILLLEICELLLPHNVKPFQQPLAAISNVTDMLPILASVAYFNLGSAAIARHTNTTITTTKPTTIITTKVSDKQRFCKYPSRHVIHTHLHSHSNVFQHRINNLYADIVMIQYKTR